MDRISVRVRFRSVLRLGLELGLAISSDLDSEK